MYTLHQILYWSLIYGYTFINLIPKKMLSEILIYIYMYMYFILPFFWGFFLCNVNDICNLWITNDLWSFRYSFSIQMYWLVQSSILSLQYVLLCFENISIKLCKSSYIYCFSSINQFVGVSICLLINIFETLCIITSSLSTVVVPSKYMYMNPSNFQKPRPNCWACQ